MTVSMLKRSLVALLALALLVVQLGTGVALSAPSEPAENHTMAEAVGSAPARAGQIYVVQHGDTLSAIARRFGVTVQAIMTANNLRSTAIFPGQSLWIPVPAQGCINKATFIADVTIPDNSMMAPGQTFVKTWRLRNDGTCAWEGYQLAYYGGASLASGLWVPMATARPSQTIDVSVHMTAPATPGAYGTNWIIRDARGATFGVGASGQVPIWARIVVGGQPPAGGTGTISGVVWEDYCRILENGAPSGGCIPGEQGGYQADGQFNNGEHGIAGIEIIVRYGACQTNSTTVAARAITDWAGRYNVGGLRADSY